MDIPATTESTIMEEDIKGELFMAVSAWPKTGEEEEAMQEQRVPIDINITKDAPEKPSISKEAS